MRRFFIVPGAPVGKARARVVTQGGYTHSYTPEKTALYERLVRDTYIFSHPGEKPLTGPVELILRAFLPVPASWPKSKKAKALAGMIQPTVKSDADNLAKSVADALNGVAWLDDKQITRLHVFKIYGVPRMEVEIWEATDGIAEDVQSE